MSKSEELRSLSDIYGKVSSFIEQGVIGPEVIDTLVCDGVVFPKEGLLWDYKSALNTDPIGLASTVLQIIAFYNTYGGYLIYGVKELKKDIDFQVTNVDFCDFDLAQLRNLIQKYTGFSIDISFLQIPKMFNGSTFSMGLIHIPKRPAGDNPVCFVRNGPEIRPNKLVFKSDDTYLRILDEKVLAKSSSDWGVLFSPRSFVYSSESSEVQGVVRSLDHNLPDRHLICSKFIGREGILSLLWEWLSDEFEYSKILCGDGGKGKTSIAYEFSTKFVSQAPYGYERVVWLSVKEKQFSGIDNDYYDLHDSDFSCARSFLLNLLEKCSLESEEYDGLAINEIKKELRSSLPIFPSLIIVDDIDSLSDDEQRKVVDYCRQLGSDKVRFLITTRKKLAYSSDLCIDIPGLEFSDYSDFVKIITTKHKIPDLKSQELEKLYNATDGSPLLSSSILRLCKQGLPFKKAIEEWKNHAGEDARSAAIQREIESLSRPAKRFLLCIYYFGGCSATELKQASGYLNNQLSDYIEELQALFIIGEPSIIEGEPRYAVSNTTALVVKSMEKELALDFNKIKANVRDMKSGVPSSGKQGNRKFVGIVIRQSIALLNDKKNSDAIKTVDEGLKSFPDNPDLILMKTRCLSESTKPDYEQIKKLAMLAVKKGQKKERVFEYWYAAEHVTISTQGIIECCIAAIQTLSGDVSIWQKRLGEGYLARAKRRGQLASFKDLIDASDSLTDAWKGLKGSEKAFAHQSLVSVHDRIWQYLEVTQELSWLHSFDEVIKLIQKGDVRTKLFERARYCLLEAQNEYESRNRKKPAAYASRARKLNEIIKSRSKQDRTNRPIKDLIVEE